MKFRSLKTRILVWFGLVTAILIILFSIGFYYFFNQSVNTSIQSKLYKEALFIENHIESNIAIEKILNDKSLSHLHIAILKDNKIINKTKGFKLQNVDKYTKQYSIFSAIDYNEEFLSAILTLKFKKPFNGTIILIEDDVDHKIENLAYTMIILNPILLFLLLFLASKLIDKILIPIKEITSTAKKINIDALSSKIEQPKYNDELKELVDTFNNMTIRLQSAFEQMERFNSDVSHEFKTPLTVIKGEVHLALRKLRKPEEYQQSLKTISYEANSMQEMVDNLQLLVQYSKENIKQTFSVIDIDTILITVLEKYNAILKEKNIKINLDKFEAIQYNANTQLLTIIFSNIIDNAIKYTSNNKNINISLFKDNKIYFIVEDEGVGVAQDKLSKITDRFYRVDESRNKTIKGFGLGLSIVKNSVELHNGALQIKSTKDIGTVVKIIF